MSESIERVAANLESDAGPATETSIRTAERVVGPIPAPLRELLGRLGGCGVLESMALGGPSSGYSVLTFFSPDQIVTDQRDHEDLAEAGLVPFADDEWGNRYVWQVEGGRIGHVDLQTSDPATPVAPSMRAFFDQLAVLDEG